MNGWQEEARRFAQNADYWRKENEAANKHIQEARGLVAFLVSCIESDEKLNHEDYVRIGQWQRWKEKAKA